MHSEDFSILGQKIKEAREECRLSQLDMAKAMNVDKRLIQQYETKEKIVKRRLTFNRLMDKIETVRLKYSKVPRETGEQYKSFEDTVKDSVISQQQKLIEAQQRTIELLNEQLSIRPDAPTIKKQKSAKTNER